MLKKMLLVVCALLMVSTGAFANKWIGGASGDWNVASNWSTGAVPTSSDDVGSGVYADDFTAEQWQSYVDNFDYPSIWIPVCPSYLSWTKQTIETYASDGTINVAGIHLANEERMCSAALNIRTDINVTGDFYLGDSQFTCGEVNQYSGDVTVSNELCIPRRYRGVYNMYDGTLTATYIMIPGRNSGYAMPTEGAAGSYYHVDGVQAASGALAALNIYGGTVTTGSLTIRSSGYYPTGLVNLAGGTLVLTGDQTADVATYVADGLMVAYNGAASVAYFFDGTNTIVTPEPITMLMLGLGGIAALRRRK